MVLIDDATNRCYARFFEEETTAASFVTFWRYVERYGLPHAVYADKASIYRTTRDATVDESLADEPPQMQFGRAMQEMRGCPERSTKRDRGARSAPSG